MASSDFKKWAGDFLKEFQKTSGEKDPAVSGRGQIASSDWNIVVIDQEPTRGAIERALKATFKNVPPSKRKKALNAIMNDLKDTLKNKLDVSTGKGGAKKKDWDAEDDGLKKKIQAQKIRASKGMQFAVVVGKFSGIEDWKKWCRVNGNGYILKAIKSGIMKTLKKEVTESELREIGGAQPKKESGTKKGEAAPALGLQFEHGQGMGIGGSTVRVLMQEERLAQMSSEQQRDTFTGGTEAGADAKGRDILKVAFEKYKLGVDCKVFRSQVIDKNLKVKASYTPVVTITSAAKNQERANKDENAFIKAFEETLLSLVSLKGSPSIGEMTRDAVLHNLNGKGVGRKTTGAGKPRIHKLAKSKGSAKGKFKRKEPVGVLQSISHTLATKELVKAAKTTKKKGRAGPRTGEAPRKSGSSRMPLHLLGILNKELPDTVRANMGEPRLTNVTGRFASSTKVVDMIPTPQGFPSIGYTYMRDPYGVFEKDHDYDPRRLIEQSVREIAAQHAIGRFYTRRV